MNFESNIDGCDTKACSVCHKQKPLFQFASKGHGRQSRRCKSCDAVARQSATQGQKAEESARRRLRYEAVLVAAGKPINPRQPRIPAPKEERLARRQENALKWYYKNRDFARQRNREYKRSNGDIIAAARRRDRAQRRSAAKPWRDEFTRLVEAEASRLAKARSLMFGFQWDVDHIAPLAGKEVCGLHIWSNLSVIPAVFNCRKRNKFDERWTGSEWI
jgi:hypothetical protein